MAKQAADHSPYSAPELSSMCAMLDDHREKLVQGLSGLSEAEMRERLLPSDTTLLGLVKHLGYIERWWFQIIFAGLDVPLPPTSAAEWAFEPGETSQDVIAFYQGEVARGRELIAGATPETRAQATRQTSRGPANQFSLRWILLHMIEETAQHNGHADILRELLSEKKSVS